MARRLIYAHFLVSIIVKYVLVPERQVCHHDGSLFVVCVGFQEVHAGVLALVQLVVHQIQPEERVRSTQFEYSLVPIRRHGSIIQHTSFI